MGEGGRGCLSKGEAVNPVSAPRLQIRKSLGGVVMRSLATSVETVLVASPLHFTRPVPKCLWDIIKTHCPLPHRTHVCSYVLPKLVLRFLVMWVVFFSSFFSLLNLRCSSFPWAC